MESSKTDREIPTVFGDSTFTIAHPSLRDELKRRIGSWCLRTRSNCPDRSDVVQEVLNVALRNRPLLQRLSAPQRSSWFWVVVSRLSARLSRQGRKMTVMSAFAEAAAPQEVCDTRIEDPAVTLERHERALAVRNALRKLPEAWQHVLALRNAHPNDWSAVADALDSTSGAARALWYRAIEGLREQLLHSEYFRDGSV
jgi:DNA-directed RNA polymerase specialized sigma24 family protein